MDDAASIAWKILYNEDFAKIPDPNKPENVPLILAKKRERAESLERLFNGAGRVLFEQWQVDIKKGVLSLLSAPDVQTCHCSACMILRELRIKLNLWVEAQRALGEKPKE